MPSATSPIPRRSVSTWYTDAGNTLFTESSFASSLGSRLTHNSGGNSLESHGASNYHMNIDDSTHHYSRSRICPSDIELNDISQHKDIIDLTQKIGTALHSMNNVQLS